MLAAPIIHARTKNNDFPSKLLVVPDDFSTSDIFWAKKYISDSTRYFELSGKEGRRVIFCNENWIVSGISIRIGDFYRACSREAKYEFVDGKRINYAFIGVVVDKNELSAAVEFPLDDLLNIYEHYMEMLWDKTYEEKGLEVVKGLYEPYLFPEAEELCDIPVIDKGKPKLVIDDKFAPLDRVMATVTGQMLHLSAYAFCSNMPNATSVIESDFFVVTSPNAGGIIEVMKKREEKERLRKEAELEEKVKTEEKNSDEEEIYFYKKTKSKFAEILKKKEEKKNPEFSIKSPKLKNCQDINKENKEFDTEDKELTQNCQDFKENPDESKKKVKSVLGGMMVFFGALWVLISTKKEGKDV